MTEASNSSANSESASYVPLALSEARALLAEKTTLAKVEGEFDFATGYVTFKDAIDKTAAWCFATTVFSDDSSL